MRSRESSPQSIIKIGRLYSPQQLPGFSAIQTGQAGGGEGDRLDLGIPSEQVGTETGHKGHMPHDEQRSIEPDQLILGRYHPVQGLEKILFMDLAQRLEKE